MRIQMKWIVAILLIVLTIAAICALQVMNTISKTAGEVEEKSSQQLKDAERAIQKAANETALIDLDTVYAQDDPSSVVTFYVTVRRGNDADDTNHSLEEVNNFIHLQGTKDVELVKAEALIQEGDDIGPLSGMIGWNETASNAIIRVRGKTSALHPQKSYRIDLLDSAGLWRGQRAIALNKHPFDITRMRNKLFFDLLKDVPNLLSLRTQFVHLYIKDETSEPKQTQFQDYGLYTQVEIPNATYLKNHGLNKNANLYKANMFEMYRYPESLKLATDPTYDLEDFNVVLESKTNQDHTNLLDMLDAVNDYSTSIEDVFEKYFDADNYFSYHAYSILMGNADSSSQNHLLYNPINSDKWYYLLWDGDGSLKYFEEGFRNKSAYAEWMRGVSNYWGVVLFNRVLRVEKYRSALNEKVEILRQFVTKEKIQSLIDVYKPIVDRFVYRTPDAINLSGTFEQYETIVASLSDEIDINYQNYLKSLKRPMPFFLNATKGVNGSVLLNWDEAYDFNGDLVKYDVEVATDWSFAKETLVYEAKEVLRLSTTITGLKPGTYYWRVTAKNESGYTQQAFDQVETSSGIHSGMMRFTLLDTGEVNVH